MDLPHTIHAIQLDPADVTLVNSFAGGRGLAAASHASIQDFLHAYRPGEAAVVVLNLGAAEEDALAALGQLRERGVLAPAIAVAEAPSTELTVGAMQRGAVSVLPRPLDRSALERELARALEMEEQERAIRARRETIASRLASLNEGEREVLTRLMAGTANKKIAAELRIGLRTVELRRAKILKKLGAKSLAEMVRLVVLAEPERLYGE